MKKITSKLLISGFFAAMVVLLGAGVLTNRVLAATLPIVVSATPTAGPATGGTAVTIVGSGFTSSSAVYFGTSTAASFTVASDTTIFATSSIGTGMVDLTIANASGTSATSSADQFTYIPVGTGPAAVNLLSAGNFAILAETQITDIPSSPIVGNIGLSAAAGSFIGVTCAEMSGTIYEVDATYTGGGGGSTVCAAPGTEGGGANKTLVDTAVGDMVTAYNAAAGITNPTATELGSGNISGMTLPPGLYKWSTDVNINSNVYLSGSANAVWVFQVAGNLNVASLGSLVSGVHVILEGGAKASNIFWQVGGGTGATLGTYSTFNGTILSAKQIIVQTGAVLNGRALAQTEVTLDANAVTSPGALVNASIIVTAVSPTSGSIAGGTAVAITGSGFTSSTAVYFGTRIAASFTVASDTVIFATSSVGTGTVDITVANANGTSATSSADRFTYAAVPVIATISTIANGTVNPTIIITGTNFSSSTATSSLTINVGSTGLTVGSVTYTDASDITVAFTGTAVAGNVTIQAATSTFNPAALLPSNSLTVTVPAPAPVVPVVSVASGGGGGGGGGGYYMPAFTGTTVSSTVPSLPNTGTVSGVSGISETLHTLQGQLLALLIGQLRILLQQAQAQGIVLPPGAAAYLTAGSMPATLSAVTENLTIGSADANVSALQSFLIAQAKGSAAATLGAAGVTGTFGSLTQAALAEYQNAVGITPAQGYFGPRTKAYLENAGF